MHFVDTNHLSIFICTCIYFQWTSFECITIFIIFLLHVSLHFFFVCLFVRLLGWFVVCIYICSLISSIFFFLLVTLFVFLFLSFFVEKTFISYFDSFSTFMPSYTMKKEWKTKFISTIYYTEDSRRELFTHIHKNEGILYSVLVFIVYYVYLFLQRFKMQFLLFVLVYRYAPYAFRLAKESRLFVVFDRWSCTLVFACFLVISFVLY